ncbi:MAG: TolC family protein [Bacteroidia bacterium]|nr:TolC family protein [Bacteroidia bacterium]
MKTKLWLTGCMYAVLPLLFAQGKTDTLSARLAASALEHSKGLQVSRLETEKARTEQRSVLAVYAPTLDAQGMYGVFKADIKADAPIVDLPVTDYNLFEGTSSFQNGGRGGFVNASVSQVLFTGLQAPLAYKALENKTKAKEYSHEKEEVELVRNVLETIDNLALTYQYDSLLDQSVQRLEAERRVLNGAVANGLAAPYDVKRLDAAAAELDLRRTELRGNRQLLRSRLAQLCGISEAAVDSLVLPPLLELDMPVQGSYQQRPEIQALHYASEAARLNYKRSTLRFLPQVKAFAGYAAGDVRNLYLNTPWYTPLTGNRIDLRLNSLTVQPAWYAGVGFKWKLFDLKEQVFEGHEKGLEARIYRLKEEDSRELLNLAEVKATETLQSAQAAIRAAQRQAEASRAAFVLARASYAEGLISISEYLAAEQDLRRARLEYHTALRNERSAYYAVLQARGQMLPFIR